MCVICYVPKGKEIPSMKMLKAMHMANPHGMGFCTPSQYCKGMNFDYFVAQLRKRTIDEPLIMHFRYATHGSKRKANCHPFAHNGIFFAHNGILSVRPIGDKTDSETAFLRYLYPVASEYGINSEELTEEVARIIEGSRFAFMQGSEVSLYGSFERYDGCYYSNLRFIHCLRYI